MKKINKDELYQHIGGFLATKGVELKDGPYANRLRQGCVLLTDCINFAQANVEKAKTKMDAKLERMRQVIHDKTAPRTPPQPEPQSESQSGPQSEPQPESQHESQPEAQAKSEPQPAPPKRKPKAKTQTATKKPTRPRKPAGTQD